MRRNQVQIRTSVCRPAIRWRYVDMATGSKSRPCFRQRFLNQAPPSLPRVLVRRVPLARRYYEALRLPPSFPPHLLTRDGYRPSVCLRSPRTRRRSWGLELWAWQLHANLDRDGRTLSSSRGILLCLCRALRPRQDHDVRPYDAVTRPPHWPRRGLPRLGHFRGSITRLQHSLSTLRPAALTAGRKTRFRCRPALRNGT